MPALSPKAQQLLKGARVRLKASYFKNCDPDNLHLKDRTFTVVPDPEGAYFFDGEGVSEEVVLNITELINELRAAKNDDWRCIGWEEDTLEHTFCVWASVRDLEIMPHVISGDCLCAS